jgi:hypothetical protein
LHRIATAQAAPTANHVPHPRGIAPDPSDPPDPSNPFESTLPRGSEPGNVLEACANRSVIPHLKALTPAERRQLTAYVYW